MTFQLPSLKYSIVHENTAVAMKSVNFLDVILSSLLKANRCFGEIHRLHFSGKYAEQDNVKADVK
jgi:hypothetical protein